MKAVILAGGTGSRLYPLTLAVNKHLLGLYDKPVIYYAIEKLVSAGISKIMLVTSPECVGDFVKLLGSGHNFKMSNGKQIQITYGVQNEPNGIAYGLYIAKDYIGTDNCILYLGDNIIEDDINDHVKNFHTGAKVFLKRVTNPHGFGIAKIGKDNKVMAIEEKPKNPKSNFAVTGLYFYDNTVFNKIANQPLSKRGEYEITYINNKYIAEGLLEWAELKEDWFDIGTVENLYNASVYMRNKNENSKK